MNQKTKPKGKKAQAKKNVAKKAKPEKKKEPELPKHSFQLVKCVLDGKNFGCTIEIDISYPEVRKIHQEYILIFEFNQKPWEERIARLQRQITKVYGEPELFQENQNSKIESIEGDIAKEMEEMKEAELNCPLFELAATVKKVPNRRDPTKILFGISKGKLNEINDRIMYFGNYNLTLQPSN